MKYIHHFVMRSSFRYSSGTRLMPECSSLQRTHPELRTDARAARRLPAARPGRAGGPGKRKLKGILQHPFPLSLSEMSSCIHLWTSPSERRSERRVSPEVLPRSAYRSRLTYSLKSKPVRSAGRTWRRKSTSKSGSPAACSFRCVESGSRASCAICRISHSFFYEVSRKRMRSGRKDKADLFSKSDFLYCW